jgi:CheY-like chemotaxis protein
MTSAPNQGEEPAPTILVVDDLDDLRDFLVAFLQTEFPACAVLGAANGQEALAVLSALDRAPCLILLDLMMPIMDGRTFLAALRKDDVLAAIPVIVVSASDAVVEQATHQLRKPFSLDAVRVLAERYCNEILRKERPKGDRAV